MRKKIQFRNGKKKIALVLAMAMTVTGISDLGFRNSRRTVYAADTPTVYFAEGFGTGVDFSKDNNSWKIETTFDNNASLNYKNDSENQAAIVNNNHSGNNEPIIRLINGVQNANLSSGDSDYRIGTAISNEKLTLKDNGQFSAKFTVSMPDACVNKAQTNDKKDPNDGTYSREVGGDGISFIITTQDSIKGQAGGGIGYMNVDDSIVVELDSYFNGAYCTFAESSTAYTNWDYDNQIYANSGLHYLPNVDNSNYKNYNPAYGYGEYWEKVLNPNGYAQLNGSSVRRFDHVGVMVDGDPKNHLGISYLNGLAPDKIENNKYVNLSNDSSSLASQSSTCATRFADEGSLSDEKEGVDNRLFTFWVEYDGTDMYVSYANGNFLTAVRP